MRVLGVFAKWPRGGTVKTRLGLPPDHAAAIAEAFLLDTLDRCTALPRTRRLVVFTPASSGQDFATLLPAGWDQEPQAEGDLGTRLAAFFARHLAGGAPVVAIGTDSPTLPLSYIEQAFAHLTDADVVLGPATDGGYYLVGARGELPPIFHPIDWSTERVLEQTIATLSAPRWRLALLPPWYDVDTATDWQLLRGHIAALRRAGLDPGIPRTERLCPLDSFGPTPVS
jgi:rSAM/selenodomain-associated transferase 1